MGAKGKSRQNSAELDQLPLCVDLDGTLVKSDLLLEAMLRLIKRKPHLALLALLHLLRGRAAFKAMVFKGVPLDVATLPYNQDFLDYLRAEKLRGRRLILTTATMQPVAEAVARHLGLFDQVIASNPSTNLSGRRKAEALVASFGSKGFSYAGNTYVDLKVWREASRAHVVTPSPGLTRMVESLCPVERVYEAPRSLMLMAIKAIRPHQWAKNVLIFAPAVFAHRLGDWQVMSRAMLAFVAFSMISSSVYLINDLLDLDSDRRHPEKKRRPFASGDLPLMVGLWLAPLLFVSGILLSSALSQATLLVLLGYFVITTAYSLRLKQVVLADVMILAVLYAWRVFAGSVATAVAPSSWFLAFLIFLFISLALVKRVSELILTIEKNLPDNEARGYIKSDLAQLVSLGSASGVIAVLVLALYINDTATRALYDTPDALWAICPIFLYWLMRIWLLAHRGKVHSDPLVFAMKDKMSWLLAGAMMLVWFLASGQEGLTIGLAVAMSRRWLGF